MNTVMLQFSRDLFVFKRVLWLLMIHLITRPFLLKMYPDYCVNDIIYPFLLLTRYVQLDVMKLFKISVLVL